MSTAALRAPVSSWGLGSPLQKFGHWFKFDIRCIPLFAREARVRRRYTTKVYNVYQVQVCKLFVYKIPYRRTPRLAYGCIGLVYKIPYRRAPRLACRLPSASREQRYLAYKHRPSASREQRYFAYKCVVCKIL